MNLSDIRIVIIIILFVIALLFLYSNITKKEEPIKGSHDNYLQKDGFHPDVVSE